MKARCRGREERVPGTGANFSELFRIVMVCLKGMLPWLFDVSF